jgi:ADP-ribose pyrophosphatase YjhB (NUDIX family)
VEPGETVAEAIVREIQEETGLLVEVERLTGVYSAPASQVILYPTGNTIQFITNCFLCKISGGQLRADGVETLDVRFFAPDQLPDALLPMHPQWLNDACAETTRAFIR